MAVRCRECLAAAEQVVAELQKAERPPLRMGDYGGNTAAFWIELVDGPRWDDGHKASLRGPSDGNPVLGNLRDDIAAMAEDRTVWADWGISATLLQPNIRIETGGERVLAIDEAKSFHLALGQMIATAKRRAAKG